VVDGPDEKTLRRLVTPEGVDLRLHIASAGERFAALAIDAAIMLGVLVAFTIASFAAFGALAAALGQTNWQWAGGVTAAIWLIGFFVLRNGYFIAFEFGPRAATPGKRAMGLRVASRDGGRLTADAIFARNAMREIEIFLPLTFIFASGAGGDDPVGGVIVLLGLVWTGGFALFPLFNRDRLRIGDLVAGSWVVRAPRARLDIDLLDAGAAAHGRLAFTSAQTGAYGERELHVLEEVLRRKDRKTLASVAERIRAKIGWTAAPDESDSSFLHAYYRALRERLETGLLYGRRRRDKFDSG